MDRYGVVDYESRAGVVRLADDMTVAVGPPWHDPGNSTLADSWCGQYGPLTGRITALTTGDAVRRA